MTDIINWCNIAWEPSMENERIIHPNEPWAWYSINEVHLNNDSSLCLGISHNPKQVEYWNGITYYPQFETGRIKSIKDFGYGTFSADIMIAKGQNIWSAFWLCGVGPWPNNGEIDICESWSNKNGSYYKFPLGWKTTNNIHYLNPSTRQHEQVKAQNISILKQPRNPSKNFVNYKVEWRPNSVTFYVNNKNIRKIGWDVCKNFVGSRMNVIFDVMPSQNHCLFNDYMKIKNFKYEEL